MSYWTNQEGGRFFTILNEYRNDVPNRTYDWKRIERIYNSQTTNPKTVRQMTNYYMSCKEKWQAWIAMNEMTGIDLTDEGLLTTEELEIDKFTAFFETYGPYERYVTRNKLPDMDLWGPIFSAHYAWVD